MLRRCGTHVVWTAVAGLLLAGVAKAADINLIGVGLGNYDTVSVSRDSGSTYQNEIAGVLKWTVTTGGTNSLGLNAGDVISTFCIDLTQNVYIGSNLYNFSVVNPLGLAPVTGDVSPFDISQVKELAVLYANHYAEALTDNTKAAAFQVAIWDIVYDGKLDNSNLGLGTNLFRSGYSLATTYVTEVKATNLNNVNTSGLVAFTDPNNQDQLYLAYTTGGGPPFVPTPAAAFGAVPLLGGLALFRRHRRQTVS